MIISPCLPGLLASHQYQGQENNCGPYAAAIVLSAHGRKVTGKDLADHMDRPRWVRLFPVFRRIPGWATFPWGIVDVLREHGLSARWSIRNKPSHLHELITSPIIVIIVLGNWRPVWAHIAILAAFDPARGYGLVDPALPRQEINWRDEKTFLNQWSKLGRILITVEGT